MKTETLIDVLGQVDPRFLEQCDAEPRKRRSFCGKTIRRVIQAAALVALLTVAVYAGIESLKIGIKNRSGDNFQLYLQQIPAATDAPSEIEHYWMPQSDAFGLTLKKSACGLGDAVHVTWEKPNGAKMTFHQMLLIHVNEDGVFTLFSGLDPEEVTFGEETLQGRCYTTLTHPTEDGEEVFYYWTDDAHHYLFYLYFDAGFPQTEREELLTGVRPVPVAEAQTEMGIRDASFWLPSIDDVHWMKDQTVVWDDGTLRLYTCWEDDFGRSCVLEQNSERDLSPFILDRQTRSIGELNVKTARSSWISMGSEQECWCFTMPDGAEMTLIFTYLTDHPMDETEKVEILDSLRLNVLPEK